MEPFPFRGQCGQFMVDVHPTIVAEAHSRIMEMNKWNECNKKLVDGMIKIIVVEPRVDAAATSTSVQSSPKPNHLSEVAGETADIRFCAGEDERGTSG